MKISELPADMMVHPMEPSQKMMNKSTYLAGIVLIVFGVVSGYFLSGSTAVKSGGLQSTVSGDSKKIVGSTDSKSFPDTTEGTLEKGGIDGEGTHHLTRPGGISQTVYLTSSVLDLSQFEGRKVKIWGATFAGAKAGWLMDVGKVETIE